jgi:hypothetical protein
MPFVKMNIDQLNQLWHNTLTLLNITFLVVRDYLHKCPRAANKGPSKVVIGREKAHGSTLVYTRPPKRTLIMA